MVNKFYDLEAPVVLGGGVNIASLMATQGVMNNTDSPVATPIEITEKKEEPTTTEQVPAATANPEPKVVTANSETPSSEVKTETVQEPQKVAEPVKQQSWQEVLKSQQPDSVLKELGFDDAKINFVKEVKSLDPKMVAFLQAWQNGEEGAYLKEMAADYKSMSAEEVMRHQLRQEYPTASEAQINALFEDEVIEKYKLDTDKFTEAETEKGKLLLDAKADRYRAELLKNQEDKLLPKPQEKNIEPDPNIKLREEMISNVTRQFNENAYTKNVVATNAILVGEGEDKFSFPVDSRALVDLAINGDTNGELLFDRQLDSSGKEVFIPKAEHQLLVATVQKYGMGFINELAKHYKSLGGKSAIEPIDNAKVIGGDNSSKSDSAPKTAAEAMAKGGVVNSGGYNR